MAAVVVSLMMMMVRCWPRLSLMLLLSVMLLSSPSLALLRLNSSLFLSTSTMTTTTTTTMDNDKQLMMLSSLTPTAAATTMPHSHAATGGEEEEQQHNSSQQQQHHHYQQILSAVSQVMFVVICVVGLCGNTLVIYVVARYSKMQTVTNTYILNLAVADECFLVGLPFLLATSVLRSWPFGYVMCKVYMTTTGINQFTSSAFLTVMSGDRYIAICHAVKGSGLRTPVISRVVALTTWMVSALLMAPLFIYSSTRVTNNTTGVATCTIFLPEDNQRRSYVVFTMYNLMASFVIPLGFIVLFYSQVISTLRKSRARKRNTRKKVTRLVLTVIVAYVICWLPYWLGQVALVGQLLDLVPDVSPVALVNYNIVAAIPMYCNSAINPILYAFLSDNFRKSFFKACGMCSFLQYIVFWDRTRDGDE
ncbi:unnamed protein product [Notodromas monacha]|uniref:G-protein coupled receptors family 1 profile domain-containing protein n=1 Tax=Notodromas monacha TaxID=399045 RepID=A0A7R9GIN6_9CRUS|nr:unnamed protein product [Notodromas monacha]CAG0922653.1 unnamed protein product [Notodromas monacha]